MITVTRRKSVLRLEDQETWMEPLKSNLKSHIPDDFNLENGIIELNDKRISNDDIENVTPKSGDQLEILDVPGVETLLIMFLVFILAKGVEVITAPDPIIPPPGSGPEDVAEMQFSGVQTSVGGYKTIPIIYGEVKAGGHVIESFTEPNFGTAPSPDDTTIVSEPQTSDAINANRLSTRIAFGWGPMESVSDIKIDNNPIDNVQGVEYQVLLGTRDQLAPRGFNESKNSRDISNSVTVSGGAVTEQTIGEVTGVEIALVFDNGLYESSTTTADLIQRSVQVQLEYRDADSGSFINYGTITITARIRSRLTYWIKFPEFDRNIVDIRVTRITADNTSNEALQNAFSWGQLVEVRGGKRAHPGIAQIAFRQMPQERTAVPRNYTAVVKGFNNIRVYSDLTTYTKRWTNNPAWCFLHWLTNAVVGPGKFYAYETHVDIQGFIDWAAYCDEEVSSPNGTEKRCTFDMEIGRALTGQQMKVLFERAGEATLVEEAGKWTAVIDRITQMRQIFTEASYVRDSGQYRFLSTLQRPSRLSGRFKNSAADWRPETVLLEDPTIEAGSHYVESNVSLLGVTRHTQILRTMERSLNLYRLSDASIDFTAGLSGMNIKAGDVIGVATLTGAIGVGSGFVLDFISSKLTLKVDENLVLDPTKSYEMAIQHQGLSKNLSTVLLRNVSSDETDWVELDAPVFADELRVGDQYSIGELTKSIEKFRVVQTSLDESFNRKITAVKYSDDIYASSFAAEISPENVVYHDPNLQPDRVLNLTLNVRGNLIDVGWTPPEGDFLINRYEIWWKHTADTVWVFAGETPGLHFTISNEVIAGREYTVAVVSISPNGARLPLERSSQVTITATANARAVDEDTLNI